MLSRDTSPRCYSTMVQQESPHRAGMRPSLGVFLAYFVVGARAACQIWCNEWTCEDNNGGGPRTDCRDCPLCAPPPAPPSPPFGPGMCANTYKECGNNGIGPCCVKRTDACMRRANHRFAMCRPVNSPPCVSTDTWVCPDEFLASPPPPPRPPWPPIPPSPPPPPPCSDKYGICTQSQVACPCSNASIGCHPRKPAAGPAHDPQNSPSAPTLDPRDLCAVLHRLGFCVLHEEGLVDGAVPPAADQPRPLHSQVLCRR